jgi:hypothetical protein
VQFEELGSRLWSALACQRFAVWPVKAKRQQAGALQTKTAFTILFAQKFELHHCSGVQLEVLGRE